MWIFQAPYDWFKSLSLPSWLKPWVQALNDVMIEIARKAGQAYLGYLEAEVLRAAQDSTLSPSQKFEQVFKSARKSAIPALITLKDSELNALIEFIVSKFKASETI